MAGKLLLEQPKAFQIIDRVGARDERRDIRPPLGRPAEHAHLHPISRGVDFFKVRDNLSPRRQMKIGAWLVPEVRFRRRHPFGRRMAVSTSTDGKQPAQDKGGVTGPKSPEHEDDSGQHGVFPRGLKIVDIVRDIDNCRRRAQRNRRHDR